MIQEEEEEGKEEEQRAEGEGDKENLEDEELVQGKTAQTQDPDCSWG